MFAKMKPAVGSLSVPLVVLLLAAGTLLAVSCQPLQCDEPDANPEGTYGKLLVIPPAGDQAVDTDPAEGLLADEPARLGPSKTQHDLVKSRNSKFLGVERSSEEQ